MMKTHAFLFLCLVTASCIQAQSVSTTTISGSLRIMDSLQVRHNINTTGNITSSGEVVVMDTMRAQKDVLVDGNANIGNNLTVSGAANLHALRVAGPIIFQPTASPSLTNPCINLLVAVPDSNGGQQLTALSPAGAAAIEDLAEADPCPQPPVIPFTWQTYGNHVSSGNRWIGTIESYDFNIKTNNTFQVVCKANGDIGLGAFGGNNINSNGKKYRLFIANSGELRAGIQDSTGKYPFVIKPNGALGIGYARPKAGGAAAHAMLSVDGLILAKEVKVAIANTHWSDYVFADNYCLNSLQEVEVYIMKHKHLPDVPSGQQINEEGVDLVEMNATLLRKIEELTLYLIEQNKRLEKLEQSNTSNKRD